MFYVGQKVVCVDAGPADRGGAVPLKERAVYTVAGLCNEVPSDLGLYLAEVSIRRRPGFTDAFRSSRFRPVVERKTDISSLKALLNPKTAETV